MAFSLRSLNGLGDDAALFFLKAELAAGGIDIVALFAAEGDLRLPGAHHFSCKETVPGRASDGRFRRQSFHSVVGDRIGLRVERPGARREDGGLLQGVVDVLDLRWYLEGDFLLLEILVSGARLRRGE